MWCASGLDSEPSDSGLYREFEYTEEKCVDWDPDSDYERMIDDKDDSDSPYLALPGAPTLTRPTDRRHRTPNRGRTGNCYLNLDRF